jgi:hypothetical protein
MSLPNAALILIHGSGKQAESIGGNSARLASGHIAELQHGENYKYNAPVMAALCECAGAVSDDDLAALVKEAQELLMPDDVRRQLAIAKRETYMSREDVLAAMCIKNTKLQDLTNAGRFPAPRFMANKRVWIESEVYAARDRITAEDTAAEAARVHAKTHRPTNRHERRKAAASK